MEIIYAKPNQVNTLGRVGENLRRDMLFDIGVYLDAYEAATFLLLHRPHGYVAAYPVHGTTVEGEFLHWPVTSADTSVEGSGECELIVYSDHAIAKTVIYKTLVLRALSDGGEIPDPLEEWQKRMLEAEETAVEAGTAAEAAAETAQGAAETAREQADRAEASAQEIAALVTPEPVTVTGSTPSITATANTRYICGTVSTLTFTPSASGICDVLFTSGSTATVLTVPSTVLWPDWFDPTVLEANTRYEINIMDGIYGAVAAWS